MGDEEERKRLIKIRGAHRGQLTKINTEAESLLDKFESLTQEEADKLESAIGKVSSKIDYLQELDEKILGLTKDEHLEEAVTNSDDYLLKVSESRDIITYRYERLKKSTPKTCKTTNTRLPKLSLCTFSGNILNWQTFIDSFNAAIENNESLSGIQKFQYLKAQLSGEAARTIEGLALTNANYKHAVELLKKRYGQSHKITAAYMKALWDIPKPSANTNELRQFYDTLESYIRGLEAQGKSADSFGDLLVPIVLDKLPCPTKQQLARDHGTAEWTLPDLRTALSNEIEALEAGNNVTSSTGYTATSSSAYDFTPDATATFLTDSKPLRKACAFCKGSHYPVECSIFTSLDERLAKIRKEQLCFNCLGRHKIKDCKSKFSCRTCKKRHHSAICSNSKTQSKESQKWTQPATTIHAQSVSTGDANVNHVQTGPVLLKTAVADVSSPSNTLQATILFDEGSTRSFIAADFAQNLNATSTGSQMIQLSSFGGKADHAKSFEEVTFSVHTISGERKEMSALIVPRISTPFRNRVNSTTLSLPYLQGLHFAHPISNMDTFEVTILIGADFYWDFVEDNVIRGPGPTAVSSKLGYLLSGPLGGPSCDSKASVLFLTTDSHDEEFRIQNYWDLESLGITDDPEISTREDHFRSFCDTNLNHDGERYVAKLPWKVDHNPLPTNYAVSMKRTRNMVNRLTPELRKTYNDIIHDQIARGFIEEVTNDDNTNGHYLPHRAVERSDSTTTPIRIVYDCSCKVGDSPSLNDCLKTGPPLQNDLAAILVRFRLNQYAFVADIEKAFLNVGLDPEDRKFTKFLWLSDFNDPDSPFRVFQFKVVLFGAVCSPFILNAAVRFHLDSVDTPTSHVLRDNIYVDNVVSGVDTKEQAVSFYSESRELMHNAGFNLRSWSSNCKDVNELAKADDVLDPKTETKVLGINWDTEKDTLQYSKSKLDISGSDTFVTKRDVTQAMSSIYDPMGLLSPVHIKGKMFLQELWKRHLSWDEPLPDDLLQPWIAIRKELSTAYNSSTIPRKFFENQDSDTPYELHVFGDASGKSYGACAYLRHGHETCLVMAKTRVVPTKPTTLPRLELLAALVASRLLSYLYRSLKPYINIERSILWSDCQIVISWVHSEKTLPIFVANRVAEIRTCEMNEIRYCPSQDNPADILTRGLNASNMQTNTLWWNGPQWLKTDSWPVTVHIVDTENSDDFSDHHTNITNTDTDITHTDITNIIDVERFSSYNRLLRVSALVLRFISNLRVKTNRKREDITAKEMQNAELVWISALQKRCYRREIDALRLKCDGKNPLVRQLRLFLDDDGLLHVGGRLHNADISRESKFPILIPSKHRFTELVILDAHASVFHSGVQSTIVHIRQRLWITNIRQRVKSLLRNCFICKLICGKAFRTPIPAPLQASRLLQAPPFTITGVDFTGALLVRDTDNKKAYICLFTCAVTRAIHLELVTDLSIGSFLRAFRRFAARRSLPSQMISDNATTFNAAAEELKRLFESTVVQAYLANHRVQWTFIPKRAAWYGGFYERLIGVTKTAVKKVLGRSMLTFDELQTVVTEIEAVINDRPLTFLSSQVDDLEPITPSHFLHGRVLTTLPSEHYDLEELDDPSFYPPSTMQRRIILMAKLQREFWQRWSHEYLAALRERDKLTGIGCTVNQIRVGDVVLIHDDTLPRLKWRKGRVEKLTFGNDGLVRSVSLRTSSGYTNRPIRKLYHLESSPIMKADSESDNDSSVSDVLHDRPVRRRAAITARQKIKDMV